MAEEANYQQSGLLNINKKMVSFDMEIAKDLPDDFDSIKDYRPLGISCAAAVTHDGIVTTWYGGKQIRTFADRMSKCEAVEMVDYLWDLRQGGYQIYTWNGLGFDFDILYEESGWDERCKEMARTHVDMMFHFFCIKGYAISLDKAAKGMGLDGKTAGMNGAQAPKLWREGQYEQVLEYVTQDARLTLDLANKCESKREVCWTSNRGKPQVCKLPAGWLSVDQALDLPEADTSWMATPWPRSKFTGWL
ncbi:MAG: ribonuclease H-like domain-containing protein [Pelolinea sp.]|nr:ribonuclease H-like domain-containing protein [Pelolinea sp.]